MPAYITGKRTHTFTIEFKLKAVRWSRDPARSVKELPQALDIHSFMLSRWRIEFRERKFGMPASNKAQKQESKLLEQYELKRLKCRVAEQEDKNDILKSGNVA